ncbi:MAG TPA: DNA topology modulation protein [Pyrinomonadaceae bacterium]|jgi:adenylate kinase family enzyme|nr:DNA topology modulation protein [Pyrinomonadaceae bacterium]
MKRVIVIGSGGAGKSTFARRLGEVTGLPVIHLDSHFWRPNWEPTPKDEWKAKVEELIKGETWIIDGNFGSTRELRMQAADTIIMLDLPRRVCMYRAIKRAILYYGKKRPDMGEGCTEKIDLEFLLWIWNYPKQGKLRAFEEFERQTNKRLITLKDSRDIESFLKEIA